LRDEDPTRPIRLALDIADGALADRLAALLAGVPGLYLVPAGDAADATIAQSTASTQQADEDDAAHIASVETRLTAGELEVLVLLAEGASNKAIARRLAISVHTAKFHVASVIDKPNAMGGPTRWRTRRGLASSSYEVCEDR
jgi:DNA-binding NarL/FixJ family response regulator